MAPERLDDRPLLHVQSRAEWRAWLAEHHAESPGVWLALDKKGAPTPGLVYDDAVEEALCFGWIDSVVRTLDEFHFKELFTPRKPRSTWARTNKERVERLIAQGLMTPAGLAAIEVAKQNGSWESLDEVEAETIPDDLAAALAAAPGAAEKFSALSSSKRRLALYWIGTAKRPETRAARIAKTVDAALEGRGPNG